MPLQTMPDDHRERRGRLDKELKHAFREPAGNSSDRWPWFFHVNADKSDWRQLVPDLHREGQAQTGKIMTYFVDKFIEVAEKAIPVIDGIERLS